MKKLLILLFFPFPILALSIVEVQIHGNLADNNYIKIYNSQEYDVDVSNYNLRKKTSTGTESSIRVFPKEIIIPSKGYLLWANSKNDFHLELKADISSTAYLAKDNAIALLDNKGNILDSLSWGSPEKTFQKDDTFEKNPGPKEIIKKENNDFYLFKKEIEVEKEKPKKIEKPEIKRNYFPLFQAFLISLFFGFLIFLLKKSLLFLGF